MLTFLVLLQISSPKFLGVFLLSQTLANDQRKGVGAARVAANPERDLVFAVFLDRTVDDERRGTDVEFFLSPNLLLKK